MCYPWGIPQLIVCIGNSVAPSTRIRIFLNSQLFLSGLKNFHVQTYPYSNRIYPSTRVRHVFGFILVPWTPLGILATENALRLPS